MVVVGEADQVCTVGTEHTLDTETTSGVFVLEADLGASVAGDEFELRLYTKIRTGGTERLAFSAVFKHAQSEPNKYSPPVPSDVSLKATLKQVAGTSRTIPWKLVSL